MWVEVVHACMDLGLGSLLNHYFDCSYSVLYCSGWCAADTHLWLIILIYMTLIDLKNSNR